MSSMLEQAIVDATALKEAALKNAEQTVIEKYSDQIKEAVDALLEQEEDLGLPPGLEADMDIPLAATDGESACPCPEEEEEVELDLSDIRKELEKIESGEEGEPEDSEELAAELAPEVPEEEEEFALEESVEKLEEDEEIEFDDNDLEEIIEKLVVDMNPTMSGWAGRPQPELEFEEEVDLARRQSDEFKEKYDAVKYAAEKLEETNKKLKNKQEKYKEVIGLLKEKIEEITVSNARLLYANRTLSSTSLNERQKSKIVEAITKAETVEEARVIFETFQNAVGPTQNRAPKSLSEIVEKKTSTLLSSRKSRLIDNKDLPNPVRSRMRKLAGLE